MRAETHIAGHIFDAPPQAVSRPELGEKRLLAFKELGTLQVMSFRRVHIAGFRDDAIDFNVFEDVSIASDPALALFDLIRPLR